MTRFLRYRNWNCLDMIFFPSQYLNFCVSQLLLIILVWPGSAFQAVLKAFLGLVLEQPKQ